MVSIGGAPAHRSFSSFKTWLSCGKQWQLSRLVRVPEVPAHYLTGGSAVHVATEKYDRLFYAETGA